MGERQPRPAAAKAAGKTADKSADTVNRSEAPARADKRDSARVVAESQRNAAILELLYATGIRVAELVSMDIADIDFSNRTIKVTGKGNKQRVVPFGLPAQRALETGWNRGGRYWPVRQRMQSSPVLPTPCSSAHEAAVSTNA